MRQQWKEGMWIIYLNKINFLFKIAGFFCFWNNWSFILLIRVFKYFKIRRKRSDDSPLSLKFYQFKWFLGEGEKQKTIKIEG